MLTLTVHSQGVAVRGVVCGQCHVVCGHLEVQLLAVLICNLNAFHCPTGKGLASLILCCHLYIFIVGFLLALAVYGQGVAVGAVVRGQRYVVCRHLEVQLLAALIRNLNAFHRPTGKGLSSLILCRHLYIFVVSLLLTLTVHGQGIAVGAVVRGQRHVVCGHLEVQLLAALILNLYAFHRPAGKGLASFFFCRHLYIFVVSLLFTPTVHGQSKIFFYV